MTSLRRYLVAGLLVWVPAGVTLLIMSFLVDLVDQTLLLLPESVRPDKVLGFRIPGLGFVLTLAVVVVTGIVVTHLFGQKLVHLGEQILQRIPLVRSIYMAAKQITETLFTGTGKSFRKVVMIQYPRPGIWTLAFQTGDASEEIRDKAGKPVTNVFVPTTPNPTSGFFLVVPIEDIIELNMSVDDGLKMIISAGVVVPKSRQAALGEAHTRSS